VLTALEFGKQLESAELDDELMRYDIGNFELTANMDATNPAAPREHILFEQYLGNAGFSVLLEEKNNDGATLSDIVLIYQNIGDTVNVDLKVRAHGVTEVTELLSLVLALEQGTLIMDVASGGEPLLMVDRSADSNAIAALMRTSSTTSSLASAATRRR